MKIEICIDETELKKLVLCRLQEMLGDVSLDSKDVIIEVKSKQNYRAEWELACYRARVIKET